MNSIAVSVLVFGIIMASAWIGSSLRSKIPQHHLSDESKDIIKVGIGGIVTLAALVLGLLVASAKNAYDTKYAEIQQGAAKILFLDRTLRQLGPQGQAARDTLRRFLSAKVDYAWMSSPSTAVVNPTAGYDAKSSGEQLEQLIMAITPANDSQRTLQARALQLVYDLVQTRWLIFEQSASALSVPLLAMLVFWIAVITAALSMLAPSNGTVRAVGALCAAAVASTIFMIIEFDQPFEGVMRISQAPLRNAIAILNQ